MKFLSYLLHLMRLKKKSLPLPMILHLIYLHTLGMILHMIYLHTLGMIPHPQVIDIGCREMRLIMNLQALVMLVMICLIFLHMIWLSMPSQSLNLTLSVGEFLVISMWKGLGTRVTVHPPSRWWISHHMFILDLVPVVLYRYQNQDE